MFMDMDSARAVCNLGGGGEVTRVAGKHLQMFAQNYYGAKFIALNQGPIMGPSPAPGHSGK